MALAFMNVGEIKKITALKGREDVIRHLQNLGFAPGTEVQVVGHNAAGMILQVKGVRIAVDRSLAAKIMVA